MLPFHKRAIASAILACATTAVFSPLARADYDASVTSTHFSQDRYYYCGAATGQMILDGVGKAPALIAGPPVQSTQDQIYSQVVANNPGTLRQPGQAGFPGDLSNNGRLFTNPAGLKGALTNYDPPTTGVGGNNNRQYVAYAESNFDTANRILAYDIDNYKVAAGAMVNGGAHWISVYGVNTDKKPAIAGANKDFKVNGFYIRDPWDGYNGNKGIGKNKYLGNTGAADSKWSTYFTPTNYGGTWQGKYAFVADPDVDDDLTSTEDGGQADDPNGVDFDEARTDAANDIASIIGLATDASFSGGAFSSTGEVEDTVVGGVPEWIVPYDIGGETTGIAMINSHTGDLDEADWDEGVLTGLDLAFAESETAQIDDGTQIIDNVTPEPTSLAILLIGGGFASMRRRRA